MTTYETLLKEIGTGLGTEPNPGSDGIAELLCEGRVVLFRPFMDGEGVTFFSVVGEAGDGDLEAALSMNLFGRDTLGGHLGLFGKTLIFSQNILPGALKLATLSECLVAFARLANEIAGRFGEGGEAAPGARSGQSGGPGFLLA